MQKTLFALVPGHCPEPVQEFGELIDLFFRDLIRPAQMVKQETVIRSGLSQSSHCKRFP